MSEKKISVFIKRPGERPIHTNISTKLENLQKIVGGYIEVDYVQMKHDGVLKTVDIICNEDGKCIGLPSNCSLGCYDFVGTIIMCGTYDTEFNDVPITFAELKEQHPELWEVQND